MGLFDSYFDSDEFNPSGGLIGRLTSLQQQQNQYQPVAGFDGSGSEGDTVAIPGIPQNTLAQTPPDGPTGVIKVGDYQMPQFAGPSVSQPMQPPQAAPSLGDRLGAGFQSWVYTPLGNPFAALANGIAGFGAGQRADANDVVPSQKPGPAQAPDPNGRLDAGFQSWAHTPAGNPFAALANGIAGFESGQRVNQAPSPQDTRTRSEVPQPLSPVVQDATLAPTMPQTTNRSATRVMAGPIMPRANPWKSRYGK
jgi:hypothetical protein